MNKILRCTSRKVFQQQKNSLGSVMVDEGPRIATNDPKESLPQQDTRDCIRPKHKNSM
jgi:hypothetical protein